MNLGEQIKSHSDEFLKIIFHKYFAQVYIINFPESHKLQQPSGCAAACFIVNLFCLVT